MEIIYQSSPDKKPARFRFDSVYYQMCEEARDLSPEGLAFLYTLRDLDILTVTSGCLYMKTCMLKYLEDAEFINRRAMDIYADIAMIREKSVTEVQNGIKTAMNRMWQGYNFYILKENYGFDESLNFKDEPKTIELIRVFCEMAKKHYERFSAGR